MQKKIDLGLARTMVPLTEIRKKKTYLDFEQTVFDV